MKNQNRLLHDVARLFNVQTAHYDGFGRLVKPPVEVILRVLRVLGAPLERMDDLSDALRQRREFFWRRGLEPVVIAWEGAPLRLKLRVPSQFAERPSYYRVGLEQGESLEGPCREDADTVPVQREIEGMRYVVRPLIVPETLPAGYHRLNVAVDDLQFETLLISSARQSYAAPDPNGKRWGLFCPLYALTTEKSWAAGNFSDLQALAEFTSARGGTVAGTLPLLSAFLDEPFDPSPYAPVSRQFWNEFYLDVTRIPEFQTCPVARAIANSAGFTSALDHMRSQSLIDYRHLMALKRRVLEELLRCILNRSSERRTSFERFLATYPIAQDYAAFRAKVERERRTWEHWSAENRDGTLRSGDYDETVKQYHLYVQWQAHEQMRALGEKTKAGEAALYLDFPLGVNRDGYDVWREREVFALEASGGAPPDSFFTKGQNWGFPPLHPEGLKRQGYRHYINCLRHHLRYAGMLRIDHIMGLHRLYWIPRGFAATEGVYVHYSAEEFYAILSLESRRYQAPIVGENLGTVPPYVNTAMATHGIHGMHVSQFCVTPDSQNALPEVGGGEIASLNTHDTPTFYGFWTERDIEDRVDLGLISEAEAAGHRYQRARMREALIAYLKSQGWLKEETPDPGTLLRAWLRQLANSKADLVLVTLEDLWLEPTPQNVPGTWEERPNWRRKARYSLEQICQMPSVTDTLKTIDAIRKQGR
jgi:4-alpha-glucanotransferase